MPPGPSCSGRLFTVVAAPVWRWDSRRTPRCSRSSMRCSCDRCHSSTRIALSRSPGVIPKPAAASPSRGAMFASWRWLCRRSRRWPPIRARRHAHRRRRARTYCRADGHRQSLSCCSAFSRSAAPASRAADDRAVSRGVAVISDSLWRRRYQADPSVDRADHPAGRHCRTRLSASCRRSFVFPARPSCGSRSRRHWGLGRTVARRVDPRAARAGRND